MPCDCIVQFYRTALAKLQFYATLELGKILGDEQVREDLVIYTTCMTAPLPTTTTSPPIRPDVSPIQR